MQTGKDTASESFELPEDLALLFARYTIGRLVRRHCLQEIEDTPPFLRKPVETLLDELLADGDKFRISVERRIAGNLAEIEPNSSHGRSIDCDEAAGLLGLSDRRVRQLATEGLLSGVKVGRKWCFNLADVLAYARKVGM